VYYTHQDRIDKICALILTERDKERLKALSFQLNQLLKEAESPAELVNEETRFPDKDSS